MDEIKKGDAVLRVGYGGRVDVFVATGKVTPTRIYVEPAVSGDWRAPYSHGTGGNRYVYKEGSFAIGATPEQIEMINAEYVALRNALDEIQARARKAVLDSRAAAKERLEAIMPGSGSAM